MRIYYSKILICSLLCYITTIGFAQSSFELVIDEPLLFEEAYTLIETNNNNYVGIITREIEEANFYATRYLMLVLMNNQGEVIALDSIMEADTAFRIGAILQYDEGVLCFGRFGIYNENFAFISYGQYVCYFNLSENSFEMEWMKKSRKSKNDSLYYWTTPPVFKPETNSCFIGWSTNSLGSHQLICIDAQNGDSLLTKDIVVPSNWSLKDLVYSHSDTSMLLHYTMGTYTEYSNIVMRLNRQFEPSGDTLFSINTHLKPLDSKALVHPNGNIYLGGEANWVDWQTMQRYKHFGVFSYSPDFEPLQNTYLTHSDTNSQPAWAETMSIGLDGSIYVASNYFFHGHPLSGALTYLYLAKLDPELNLIWEKYIGGDRYYSTFGVKATSDMGVIVSGYGYDLNYPETGGFAWIVKFNPDGTVGFENKIKQQQKLVVYPNPSSGHIHIKSLEAGSLMIYNTSGQLVILQQLNQGLNQINMSALPGGTFFIHSLTNNQNQRQKIIKY
jgi:hypothetical protein